MSKFRIAVLVAIVALIGVTLGCSLPAALSLSTATHGHPQGGPGARFGLPAALSLSTATPTPTPPSTPTQVSPQGPSMPEEPASALEAQVEGVYELAGPAVVNITSRSYAYDFFMRPIPQEGSGSGFVYDTEGHIVTNYHVIENAEELSVTLADGEVHPAKIVGADPSNDLAVIRIEANDLPQPIARVIRTACAWGNLSSPSATPLDWSAR